MNIKKCICRKGEPQIFEQYNNTFRVFCDRCGRAGDSFFSKEEAIKYWNDLNTTDEIVKEELRLLLFKYRDLEERVKNDNPRLLLEHHKYMEKEIALW